MKQIAASDPASLEGPPGRYRIRDSEWVVSRRGDELRMLSPIGNEVTLLPQGKDAYVDLENGSDWSFERDSVGTVARLVQVRGGRRIVAERVATR